MVYFEKRLEKAGDSMNTRSQQIIATEMFKGNIALLLAKFLPKVSTTICAARTSF